jgi:hypothetical protein
MESFSWTEAVSGNKPASEALWTDVEYEAPAPAGYAPPEDDPYAQGLPESAALLQSATDAAFGVSPQPPRTPAPPGFREPLQMEDSASMHEAFTQPAAPAAQAAPAVQVPPVPPAGRQMAEQLLTRVLTSIVGSLPGPLQGPAAIMRSPQMVMALLQFVNTGRSANNSLASSEAAQALEQFVQTTLSSLTPADVAKAVVMGTSLLTTYDAHEIVALLTGQPLAPGSQQPPVGLPAADLSARAADRPKPGDPAKTSASEKHPPPPGQRKAMPVPERDERGRHYSPEQRKKIAQLGPDPRRGASPENQAALLASERYGAALRRSPDPRHDFCDERGMFWDVVAPTNDGDLLRAVDALAQEANVIVFLGRVSIDEAAYLARVATTPLPGERIGRVFIVGET